MEKDKKPLTDLGEIKPFNPESYENMDLNRLTVYGIWFLQEKNIAITFETLVVALFRMFPQKFCLVGFKDYPDAARVNRALLQLRPKYRNWAVGNIQSGFILTETGKTILEQTKRFLRNPRLQTPKKPSVIPRTRNPQEELQEVQNSHLYQKYQQGDEEGIDKYAIWELLHAYPYTPKKALNKRIRLLEEIAKEYKPEILNFFKWIRQKYSHIFKLNNTKS